MGRARWQRRGFVDMVDFSFSVFAQKSDANADTPGLTGVVDELLHAMTDAGRWQIAGDGLWCEVLLAERFLVHAAIRHINEDQRPGDELWHQDRQGRVVFPDERGNPSPAWADGARGILAFLLRPWHRSSRLWMVDSLLERSRS
jgi:hypothetical protein